MLTCPHCKATISSADLARQLCPHCHQEVSSGDTTVDGDPGSQNLDQPSSARPPKPATIVESAEQTLDLSVQLSSPSSELRSGSDDQGNSQTIDDPASAGSQELLDRTIDSVSLPPKKKPATMVEDATAATIDHDSSKVSDVDRNLNDLWGTSLAGSKPQMTMHGSSRFGSSQEQNSTLVIRERALRAQADVHLPIADYDLLEVLGEGGMGVVYSARQASIDREVAVKMLRPEMLASDSQRRKFLSEAAVTGELDHPNIVPIYDLGQNADGALFYSMKKVQGTPWSKTIRKMSLIDNLSTLLKVADAVAFAHARGVVHRDLKPENVMLGDFGKVLVLDWGLAVATEGHRQTPNVTTAYSIAGTPAYMAPELASGPMEEISKASDIYLLGAILYEIVTGKPPHWGRDAKGCLRAAARNDILPTEKRGELVDIAKKAMATKPRYRYGSVKEFQDAVRAYQAHSESIALAERAEQDLAAATASDDYRDYARALFAFEEAHALWHENKNALEGISRAKLLYSTSAWRKHDYDLGLSLVDPQDGSHAETIQQLTESKRERDARQQRLKTARRIMVALAALVFAAVSIGIVLVSMAMWEAQRQAGIAKTNEQIAIEKEKEAKHQAGIAETNAIEAEKQAKNARREKDNAERQEGIAKGKEEEGRRLEKIARDNATEATRQAKIARQNQADAEYEAYSALIGLAAAKIEENAFGQADQALLACQKDRQGWEWRRLAYVVQQGRGREFQVGSRIERLAWDAAHHRPATGSRDGVVRVWPVDAKPVEYRFADTSIYVSAVAFSPADEHLVAVGSNAADGCLRIWNWQTGEVRTLAGEKGHREAVTHIAFSRAGDKLLTASRDRTAKLWDFQSGQVLQSFVGHSHIVWSAVFSPDESHIATASEDRTVRLWNVETGKELTSQDGRTMPFEGHHEPVYAVAFLPAGEPDPTAAHADQAVPGVTYVASGGYDNRVLLWKPTDLVPFDHQKNLKGEKVPQTPYVELLGHTAAVRDLRVSGDGKRILSAGSDHTLRLWYARDEDIGYAVIKRGTLDKVLRGHDGPVQAASFMSADFGRIVSGGA